MKKAAIIAIEYHLPPEVLTNSMLEAEFPEWSVDKIAKKTGIIERHVSGAECASDLAAEAARKLFHSGVCQPSDIDYILLCTQSPDYFLPTTACILQHNLGIPTTAGALDFNLGCSGFVYGLGLAKGLIETGQASRVLLLTAETYSKFIHPQDKSVRTIFGDAAAATLVEAARNDDTAQFIGPFVFGTDGAGAQNLIVPTGGMRRPRSESARAVPDEYGNWRSEDNLFMNGAEIFTFTLRVIPQCIDDLLKRSDTALEDIDLFVFHQANQHMLEHLRQRMKISTGKFVIAMSHCGNTVSSTIPIGLKHAMQEGKLKPGHLVMIVGFGVGYSWGAGLVRWI